MLNSLSQTLHKYATGKIILMFLALVLLFQGVIVPNLLQTKLAAYSGGNGPMDLLMSYSPATAFSLIQSYGEEGRAAYRSFATSWDVAYPAIYSLFFAFALSWLLHRGFASNSKMQLLNLVPLGGWLFDWLENIGIVTMLNQYPHTSSSVATFASTCTSIKWGFAVAGTVVVMIALIAAIKNRKNNVNAL